MILYMNNDTNYNIVVPKAGFGFRTLVYPSVGRNYPSLATWWNPLKLQESRAVLNNP